TQTRPIPQPEPPHRSPAARRLNPGAEDDARSRRDDPPPGMNSRRRRAPEGQQHEQCHVTAKSVRGDERGEGSEYRDTRLHGPHTPGVPPVVIAPIGERLRPNLPLIESVSRSKKPEKDE